MNTEKYNAYTTILLGLTLQIEAANELKRSSNNLEEQNHYHLQLKLLEKAWHMAERRRESFKNG